MNEGCSQEGLKKVILRGVKIEAANDRRKSGNVGLVVAEVARIIADVRNKSGKKGKGEAHSSPASFMG